MKRSRNRRSAAHAVFVAMALVLGVLTSASGSWAATTPVAVSGTVTSGWTGQAVPHTTVAFTVTDGAATTEVASAQTDAAGKYAVSVPVGTYTVEIAVPDRPYGPRAELVVQVAGSGVVDLVLDDTTTELFGQITADGQPLPAIVELKVKTPTPYPAVVARTTTDDQGNYRFANVDPGNYYLFARAQGEGYVSKYYPDAAEWQTSEQVAVPSAVSRDLDLDVAAPPGNNTIRGQVTGAGQLVPATVGLFKEDSAGVPQQVHNLYALTDSAGNYEFKGLAAGTYYVTAAPQIAGEFDSGYFRNATRLADAEAVVLATSEVVVADVVMPRKPLLSGTVTHPKGKPVEGAAVAIEERAIGEKAWTLVVTRSTDVDGSWAFASRPGQEYRVSFKHPGFRKQWYRGVFRARNAEIVAHGTGGVDARLTRGSPSGQLPQWDQLCEDEFAGPDWLRALARWACGLPAPVA